MEASKPLQFFDGISRGLADKLLYYCTSLTFTTWKLLIQFINPFLFEDKPTGSSLQFDVSYIFISLCETE